MLLIKYWKRVFTKENKKILWLTLFLSEIIGLVLFFSMVIIINLFSNNFNFVFWDTKNNKLYLIFGLLIQFAGVLFIWYSLIKIRFLTNMKAEDLIRSDSHSQKEKFSEFIIDDRTILPLKPKTIYPIPVSTQDKLTLKKFEEYYPKTDNTDKVGLVIRNVYNNKAKKLEQYISPEEHCAIFGTTGSGKSVLLAKPTILYFIDQIKKGNKISSFIFDPKGDLYNLVYDQLQEYGINSYMLDFDNPESSCAYNFLSVIWDEYHEAFDYLRKDLIKKVIKSEATLQSYTHNSSKCFLHNLKPCDKCFAILKEDLKENGSIDLYFNSIDSTKEFINLKYFINEEDVESYKNSKYNSLMGLVQQDLEQLYLEFVPDKLESGDTYFTASPRKWLVTFSLLLLELNIASGGRVVKKEEFNLATIAWILSKPKEATEWLNEYKELDGAINSKAVEAIEVLNKIPADNQGSFLIEISNRLALFSNDMIKKVSSPHDVNIREMFSKSTLFFVKLEPNKIKTMGSLVTILCNQIYNEQTKYVEEKRSLDSNNDKLDVTWINLIDEFSNLPPILELESKLSFCRSRQIFWYMFIQEKEQIKSRYNETVQKIILSQARTTVYLMGDREAKEYVVNNAGKRKIIKNNVDSKNVEKTTLSDSVEDLLTVDELRKKPFVTAVVLNQNKPPAVCYLTPVFKYNELKDINGDWLLSPKIPLIPVSKNFRFNWNKEGKFNIFEYDVNKFELKLIDPELYKNKEELNKADEFLMNVKTIIDPLEAIVLNGNEVLAKSGTEMLDTIKELISKYVNSNSLDEKEEIIEQLIPLTEDLNLISSKLKELNIIRKKRSLNKVEKKQYLDYQNLFMSLKRNN